MHPLVSIIIPVYQAEETISCCLNSVLAQTYPYWEAICVNDGSTDASGQLLEQYASRDERIKVIHQENQGVSSARNKALDSVRGEYVTFVDSDDWIEPNLLEELILPLIKSSYDMSMCSIISHTKGENLQSLFFPYNFRQTGENEVRVEKITGRILRRIGSHNYAVLFRTAIIQSNKIRYELKKNGEDALFILKYLSYIRNIVFIKTPLYHYITNNDHSAVKKFYSGFVSLADYRAAFSTCLQCIDIDPHYISRKDWCCGLLTKQCDSWLNHRILFADSPKIKQLNDEIFIHVFKKLYFPSFSLYSNIRIIKTLLRALIKKHY